MAGRPIRIAFASDLHLGITDAGTLGGLARGIAGAEPAALVLLGDLGEGPRAFADCLEMFADVAPVAGAIAGNHDVWAAGGWSSADLLRLKLPEIAAERGFRWLEDETLRLGDVAVVASLAWYDYSAIDPAYRGRSPVEIARLKGRYNNDAFRIDWRWTDPEVAERCRESVRRRIEECDADPGVRAVVLGTHVPIVEEQMVRKAGDAAWGFSNAYFGHLGLGEVVLRSKKVVEIVSGHTHVGRDAAVARPPPLAPVRARVIGSRYGEPVWVMVEVPPARAAATK